MEQVRKNLKKKNAREKRDSNEKKNSFALAGNRTRASRVAGENSTTEPQVLNEKNS